ncbi:putative inorganic phosphate cotransporter [Scaptodrosophila lebanonensis]|uniref:Putative inorganic phosphate cotransporter n=1 Tax=Drosophila lebanonensis TaxID=7225 RepID=A0A6J2TPI2_DROLE|nr:putative inorganic phosphate cotransporter [Scaptodrosophila lebanonensis]
MAIGCFNCFNRDGYQLIGTSGPRFGVRHLQCILAFFGLAVAYSLRVNLSVAIVAMTDRNASNPNFPEFDWDESVKSYLLSSFFWGYVVTQVPGGYLSAIYGAKYMLFWGLIICSCLALLTPFCAMIGDWQLLVFLRAVQGLCQGVIFPSMHTFLSKWAPVEERGRLVGYCYSGSQFGTVVMLSISGYIASSLGWPSIFYVSGCFGILWSVLWFYYSASIPAQHPTITHNERFYIESSSSSNTNRDSAIQLTTPWRRIFTSAPVLVLVVSHCTNNWGFWTLLTEIPTFLKSVLGMDIRHNGPLSALPYLTMCLLTYVFIWLSDLLKQRNTALPLNYSRKIFNTLGMWLPALALLGLGYITAGGDNAKVAIALLTIAVATNSATYLGFHVNHIDLSPNFAGTLMGISNCAANVMSILAPLSVGVFVTDETNPVQWRIVFFFSAFMYFFGSMLFILFGRTDVQSWNTPSQQQQTRTSISENLAQENSEEPTERAPLYQDA